MFDDPQADEAAELARSFLDSRHGNAEMLGLQITEVIAGKEPHTWIVKANLHPKIGWPERIYYHVNVNLMTGQVDLQQVQ
ncbi:MAG: hypothetical protein HY520_03500 [Candidatus Aenigmarchaeota archaeon]|nr:hypothetical protein [Candidatus Aenigmarchaeota archaeon]